MTIKLEVNVNDLIQGLEKDYDTMKKNARPAAQKMANAFYLQAKFNVSRLNRVTGNLYASIYQVYDEESSGDGVARYVVSWRTAGKGLPKAPHGHLIEFGYVQTYARYFKDGQWYTNKKEKLKTPRIVPGYPFMRNAHEQALSEALADGEEALLLGVAQ